MKFSEKVQQQFKKAGWNPNRNVSDVYENQEIFKFHDFPKFLKDFLFEFGDLTVEDINSNDSEVTNRISITPDYASFEFEDNVDEDYVYYKSVIGKDVFPFAFTYPDGYRIASDSDGKVYMFGDHIFKISDNLKEGIEILITDDWSKGYSQLDLDSKAWVKTQA
nr:SUKH-3 domain-containing protein [uncultured Flavobacterium sp.]